MRDVPGLRCCLTIGLDCSPSFALWIPTFDVSYEHGEDIRAWIWGYITFYVWVSEPLNMFRRYEAWITMMQNFVQGLVLFMLS
jgi:hypothetical protein